MNLAFCVVDVDHVVIIRSELSITTLEKKNEQNSRSKVTLVISQRQDIYVTKPELPDSSQVDERNFPRR